MAEKSDEDTSVGPIAQSSRWYQRILLLIHLGQRQMKRYQFDKRKDIKGKLNDTMKRIWHQIYIDYKLAENCPLELQQEMIGENNIYKRIC